MVGFTFYEAQFLDLLASYAFELDRLDEALRHSCAALMLSRRTGQRRSRSSRSHASPASRPDTRTRRARGACGVRSKPKKPVVRSASWEQQRDELAAPVLAVSGAEFERGRVAGRRLTLDEAVDYALEVLPMRDLPSGTVTFLFTDVEGSTKLLHELGAEAYAEALTEHRRVMREAFAAEGGVEVDTQGDAFFFAFPTAAGALARRERWPGARGGTDHGADRACTRARRSHRRGLHRRRRAPRRTGRRFGPRRPGDPLGGDAELVELTAHRPRRAPPQGHRRARSRSSSSATGHSRR